MYVSKILQVLYSPKKTLKDIIQNPKYIGPILVMILLVGASVAAVFSFSSRVYDQQFLPQGSNLDEWTQNSTLWTSPSNAVITESNDSITGTYYGNASMAFSASNSMNVSMQLDNIGSVNCSSPNGYDTVSLRVKQVSPDAKPENVTIQMFTSNSSDGFSMELTDMFSNSTNTVWNNLTVPLASAGWSSIGQNPDWSNVTGLRLQFTWTNSSNINVLVDGLFFLGPYTSRLEAQGTGFVLTNGVFSGVTEFVVTWVVLSGLIYVVVRAFGSKLVWKPLLIAVGFILITMFIGTLVVAIGYSAWPTVRVPFEIIGGVPGEGTAANKIITDQTSLVYNIDTLVQYIMWIWTAVLASVVTRLTTEFSWGKSALVGVLSYFITLLVVGFIVG